MSDKKRPAYHATTSDLAGMPERPGIRLILRAER